MKRFLFLLPLPISETENSDWIGASYKKILLETRLLFVENIRTARRFISSSKLGISIEDLQFEVLDKDTNVADIQKYIDLLIQNGNGLVMSESGCPGIADPGAKLVDACQKNGITVVPFVGPSSIILALMGAGLSGQCFAFNGYLPIDKKEREIQIKQLQKESFQKRQAQIFIETPYRNSSLWDTFLEVLNPETKLGFAIDILGNKQNIKQLKVLEWRRQPKIVWEKLPAVFLFQS